MRARRFGIIIVCTILAGATWFLLERDDERSSTVSAVLSRSAPGWDGVREVPLSPRHSSLVSWSGEELIVFGGTSARGGGVIRNLDDGARYDPMTGEWRQLAPAPFDAPPRLPVGIWTGRELLVFGVLCRDVRIDPMLEDQPCEPGMLAMAGYDPADDSWRTIGLPADAEAAAAGRYHNGGLGWTGQEAVFLFGDTLWALAMPSEEWRTLPAPPFDPRGWCVEEGTLTATSWTDDFQRTLSVPPTTPGEAIVYDAREPPAEVIVSTLIVGDSGWTVPRRPPFEIGLLPVHKELACGGGQVLFHSVRPEDGPGQRLDLATGAWSALPAPLEMIGVNFEDVWTGDRFLLFGSDGPVSYDPAAESWKALDDVNLLDSRGPASVTWVGDRTILQLRHTKNFLLPYP